MDQNYNVNTKRESDEIEIDLMEIFAVLMRWMWVIAAAAIVGGAIMFVYSTCFITPTYESTTRIVVLNTDKSDDVNLTDLQVGTQLTNDYSELIKSRYVVESVITKFELKTTYEKFVKNISVSTPSNTRIIDITLTDTDPYMAKAMVDELRNVAAVRIKEVMAIEAVNVVDEGNVPTQKAAPSIKKYTLIGILIGGFLAVAVVIIVYLLDDTIKSSEDVERYLHLSTLGLIPIIESEEEVRKNRQHQRRSKSDIEEERSARRHSKAMVGLNGEPKGEETTTDDSQQ